MQYFLNWWFHFFWKNIHTRRCLDCYINYANFMRDLIVRLFFHLKDDYIHFVWFFLIRREFVKRTNWFFNWNECVVLIWLLKNFLQEIMRQSWKNWIWRFWYFFFWIDMFSDFRFDNNIFHFYNSAVKVFRIQKNHDVFIIFHFDCAFYHLIDSVKNFLKRIENNSAINNDLIWRKSINWIIKINIEFLVANRAHNCWMKKLILLLLAKKGISIIQISSRDLGADGAGISINSGPSISHIDSDAELIDEMKTFIMKINAINDFKNIIFSKLFVFISQNFYYFKPKNQINWKNQKA